MLVLYYENIYIVKRVAAGRGHQTLNPPQWRRNSTHSFRCSSSGDGPRRQRVAVAVNPTLGRSAAPGEQADHGQREDRP
jgi:hypothetical protein